MVFCLVVCFGVNLFVTIFLCSVFVSRSLLPHCRFKGYNAIKYLKIPTALSKKRNRGSGVSNWNDHWQASALSWIMIEGRGPGKMVKPDTVVSSHATGSENSAFERSTFELENVFEELRGLRAFSKGSVVDDRGDRFYIRGRKAPFFRDPVYLCTVAQLHQRASKQFFFFFWQYEHKQ